MRSRHPCCKHINSTVIGVGSNIDPALNVARAEKEVALLGNFFKKSGFRYTKPLHFKDQDNFLNGAFYLETSHNIFDLNQKLKEIESKLGRVRTTNKSGPRTIDLDIVIFNNQVKDPDVFTRGFVRGPVKELVPELENALECSGYSKNFKIIHNLIEHILLLSSQPPLSIYGKGRLFFDGPDTDTDADTDADADAFFYVIGKDGTADKSAEFIRGELQQSLAVKNHSLKVAFSLVRLSQLKKRSIDKPGQSESSGIPGHPLFRGLSHSKLLYGASVNQLL